MTSQTINLNLIPGSIEPVINVSQYDKGQTWNFNIYSGSQPFTIPTGSSITIQGTKPDKTGFQYGCTFSGNVVTAIEQQQMTILSGKVPAEIVITKDDELIGSLNFNIMVEKAALADDTAISETDLPLIEEAVEALSHIDETLETMKGYKEDSEAYAIGKRNGSDVGSSDPAYHNNSRYYAGQASSSASSASGSATSAGTNALISEGYAVGKQNGSAVGSGSPYYQNNAEYYKGQAANSATNAGNSATAASGSATTASNKALVAEGYADGKQNGTDVASGSPYYHNNSKYYSEQAAASAQSAAQSAASFTVDSTLSTSSTNPVQNKVITTDLNNVKQALSNEVVTRATLGAHNLWPITLADLKELNTDGIWNANAFTRNGVTFTANVNGGYVDSISMSGANNSAAAIPFQLPIIDLDKDLILSGAPVGGGVSSVAIALNGGALLETGNGIMIPISTTLSTAYIRVAGNYAFPSGGLTVNPMIRLATDSDRTFRPYVPTNVQLLSYKDNGVLGAKNFALPIKSYATTSQGITTSTDADGITTITGTATSSGGRLNIKSDNFVLKKGTYKIVGIPNDTTKYLDLLLHDPSNNVLAGWGNTQTPSQPDTVTLTTDTVCFVGVNTYNGTAYGTGAFKFGFNVQLASDSDLTYQPYAMTNKQLTDEVTVEDITSKLTAMSAQISTDNTTAYRIGKLVIVNIFANLTADLNLQGKTLYNLDSSIKPKSAILSIIECIENPADSATLKESITIRAISVSNNNIINVPNDAGSRLSFTTTTNTQIRGQIVFAIE